MTREKSNLAASVRQRLLNLARSTDRPFNELLQYFAMERFLYRLSCSPHTHRFVLKGGLLLASWRLPLTRPTKDIDLLGAMANDVDAVATVFQEVCSQMVEQDGMEFDPASVAGEYIAEEAEYGGVRVRFRGVLGTARVTMQIDVGFGDAVVPAPVWVDYPGLLDLPPPRIRGYTPESVVAEKFHIMVLRGLPNSRVRDFFDIWALSRRFDFEGGRLVTAIRETFSRRGLDVPALPVALTDEFATDAGKAQQWRGFLRRSLVSSAPSDLGEVIRDLRAFLGPLAQVLHHDRPFDGHWRAGGPWS